jgi:hypothetical protein
LKKPRRKIQRRKPGPGKLNPRAKESVADDDFELTKVQLRELDRRMADAKDPVRYLIEGGFGPRFKLYYNVTDDVYVMNDAAHATLFKRRKAAVAVQKLLGGGKCIVRCTTRRRKGQLIPVLPSRKRTTRGRRSK